MAAKNRDNDPFHQYNSSDPFASNSNVDLFFENLGRSERVDNPIGSDGFGLNAGHQQDDLFGHNQPQPAANEQKSGGSRRGGRGGGSNPVMLVLVTAVAVLLLVGIVIGVLLIVQNKQKDDSSGEAPVAETTVSAEPQTEAGATSVAEIPPTQSAPQETISPPVIQTPATAPSSAPNAQYHYPPPTVSRAETNAGEVLASSNVNSARSFGADQAIDGYANTCWCVNTNSTGGAGGALTIYLKERSTVSGIAIINGNTFQPEEYLYRSNGQVRNFTLTFSDGTSISYQAGYNYATSQFESFRFAAPVVTDRVTLRVDSGYPGEKYTENVCIGEISVF